MDYKRKMENVSTVNKTGIGRIMYSILSILEVSHEPKSVRWIREQCKASLYINIAITVLYNSLDRLEKRGLISWIEKEATGKKGERSMKLFMITNIGREVIEQNSHERKKEIKRNVSDKQVTVVPG
jgi:DNA-binding PadR family transcriptional regulator